MEYTYEPVVLCTTHDVSMHDNPYNREHHERNWHSPEYPCSWVSEMELNPS